MTTYLLEEELNPVGLSDRTKIVLRVLKMEISKLENGDERDPPTSDGNKKLKVITGDYQELVVKVRKARENGDINPKAIPVADKLEESWKYIYSRMRRYDELVEEYNKTHNPKLEFISKRTGDKIEESVKYFDY